MLAIIKNQYLLIFLISAIGYLIGRIEIKGLSLGTSGVLLVALVFGHFGLVTPGVIKTFGLCIFVGAVGVIAGPVFFKNFKKGALQYIILGFVTIITGALVCIAAIKLFNIPTGLASGLMTGALTSTPGLAAAQEATGDPMAAVGYGIAYPFGVVGVVLFVQLLPRILKTDIKAEMSDMVKMSQEAEANQSTQNFLNIEPSGFFEFAVVIAIGVAIGLVKVPLGNGASFSLGTSGGPLIAGLIIGHFGHIGPINMRPPKNTMNVMREFGLCMFLVGAGTEAGQGFIEVLKQYGASLFIIGAFMTLIPMILDLVLAKTLMKMKTLDALGSITGGMTSTPALGTLIQVAGNDAIAVSYAATYPIALVMVVLAAQFIGVLL
jgi:putative transport protein